MSGISSVSASGGFFTITDAGGNAQKVDLGVLLMMINMTRTKNLDDQIAIQLSEIQDRNKVITQLTEMMSFCRKLKSEGWGDGTSSGKQWQLTINGETKYLWVGPYDSETKSYDFSNTWANELGIDWSQHKSYSGGKKPSKDSDVKTWEATWDTNINNIKSKIELLNNDSQMANIKLQNLLEKRNNAFEMTTKVMDTNNQSVQSVLRNL